MELYRPIKVLEISCTNYSKTSRTNAIEAKNIIDNSGLNVHSAVTLKDAADKVKELVN